MHVTRFVEIVAISLLLSTSSHYRFVSLLCYLPQFVSVPIESSKKLVVVEAITEAILNVRVVLRENV